MKYLLTIILIAFGPLNDLDRIATINALKKEAQVAYANGDYQKALENYKYLVDSMEVKDDNVLLNLANSYYKVKDTTNALDTYQILTSSNDKLVRSVAQQQLGIMANKSKKFDQALEHFKEAIKANPANEDARYNYELLKKLLKEQEKQNKEQNKDQKKQDNKEQQDQKEKEQQKKDEQQKNKDQQQEKKEGEGKEQEEKDKQQNQKSEEEKEGEQQKKEQQKPQDGEESDKKNQNKQDQMSSLSDKLKDMKISEEKAKMILQALRNKEIQYYQQNKRKATKPKNGDKPDW